MLWYYAMGLLLAWWSYVAVGHTYIHAPALYHLVILIVFMGGVLWLILATILYFARSRSDTRKGIILTHLVIGVCSISFATISIVNDSEPNTETNEISLEESGDTTVMYYDGRIIHIKVGDSVLIDFIDSTEAAAE